MVALDPATGAILAAVSTPSFDPNALSSHSAERIQAAYKRYNADPDNPLLNRAFSVTYPPGSVFKVVVASAALKNGRTPQTRIPAPNTLTLPQTRTQLRNFGGEQCADGKTDTLIHALTISCNTAFAQLGMDLGTETLRREAALFGIDDSGFDIPLERGGRPRWGRSWTRRRWPSPASVSGTCGSRRCRPRCSRPRWPTTAS